MDLCVVVLSSLDIILILVSKSKADVVWNKLKNEVPNQAGETENETNDPLSSVKAILMNLKSPSTVLDNEELSKDDNKPDGHEHSVGEDTVENIKLVIDLSSSKHVPNLHEHEQVEDNGQVSRWSIGLEMSVDVSTVKALNHARDDVLTGPILSNLGVWMTQLKFLRETNFSIVPCDTCTELWDELRPSKDKDEENDSLIDGHTEDMLDHLLRDDVLLLSVWWSLEEIVLWKLSGESQRSKRVHD